MSFHKKLCHPTFPHRNPTQSPNQANVPLHRGLPVSSYPPLILHTHIKVPPLPVGKEGTQVSVAQMGRTKYAFLGRGEGRFQGQTRGASQTSMVARAGNPWTVWRLRQEDGCETSLGYRGRPCLTNKQTRRVQPNPENRYPEAHLSS